MTEDTARLDRVFMALGAMEAGLSAIEKAKLDKVDAGRLTSKVESLEKDKADRHDLMALKVAFSQEIHAEISDLSTRLGGRLDSFNSKILDIVARLDAIGHVFDSRGAELAKMREVIEDLARAIHETAEAARLEKANRGRIWRRRLKATSQFAFQAFAGLALLVILVRDGVTNVADLMDAARVAFGAH